MEYQFNAVFSFNSLVLFCLIFSLNKVDEYHNMPNFLGRGYLGKGFDAIFRQAPLFRSLLLLFPLFCIAIPIACIWK